MTKRTNIVGTLFLGTGVLFALWFLALYIAVKPQLALLDDLLKKDELFRREHNLQDANAHKVVMASIDDPSIVEWMEECLRERENIYRQVSWDWEKRPTLNRTLMTCGSYLASFKPPNEISFPKDFVPGIVEVTVLLWAGAYLVARGKRANVS